MNATGHPTRYRPEYCKSADDCCLPGAGNPELAEFLGVASRAIENSIATLGAHRTRQHHPWCFALLPTLYTGTKELSYPARRRLGPETQAQGRVVKLTLTPEVRHMPTPGQPTSYKPEYGEPDAVIARSLFGRPGTDGRLQIGMGGRLPPESAANSGALCGE
jgi:hypothetical protein